jgi:AcrR family transcriptional regulator
MAVVGDPDPEDPTSSAADAVWRERAIERSTRGARQRAAKRVQQFLDAAREIISEKESIEFTVQEVVDRSKQSLRSFYQYFDGKHELLLALFEEAVRSTAEQLREQVEQEDNALDRLHRFVVEYYRVCRPAPKSKAAKKAPVTPVMIEFAQQLLTRHPAEAARAFAPLVALFGEVLDDAAEAGMVRDGLRHRPIAGIVLEAIMFNVFSTTIGGTSARVDGGDPAEELWDLILNGIGS